MRRLLYHTLQLGHRQPAFIHEVDTEDAVLQQAMISRPSVVVIDAELALGNGLSACARLKANPLTRAAAVVVVSGGYDRTDFDDALAAGADAFLVKPFSTMRLRALVTELCAEARLRAAESPEGRARLRAWRSTPAHVLHPERYDLPPVLHYAALPGQARIGSPAGAKRLAG
jgi:CheY-like chemotaxis protein